MLQVQIIMVTGLIPSPTLLVLRLILIFAQKIALLENFQTMLHILMEDTV